MPDRRFLLSALAAILVSCSSNGTTNQASSSGSGGSTASSSSSSSSSASSSSGTGGSAADGGADAGPIGGNRPVVMHVPASYQPGTPVPLVLMLHGYSANANLEELYLDITPVSDQLGFVYARANGTLDPSGNQFWNATDACCNLFGSTVDDSTYLSSVITEIEGRYSIDPKRVFLVGHSNGAFMSYRMACDHADQIAAIVSLAGAMWEDTTKCTPTEPVSILEIHGTADMTIAYDGGAIAGNAFPSAPVTVSDWVTLDGCSTTPDLTAPPLDLDSSLPGDETTVTKYGTGCKTGGHAELWTIAGGMHIPALSATFTPDLIQFLYAHGRP